MKLKIVSFTHSLTFKIFALFWFNLGLLLAVIFFVLGLDSRLYSYLDSNDLKFYHQEIVVAMQDHQFARILVRRPKSSSLEKRSVHPILVDSNGNIIGATKEELPFVREFNTYSNDVSSPKSKSFVKLTLAGPFSVHLTHQGKQKPYLIYFASKDDHKKQIISYIFEHPFLLICALLLISKLLFAWLVYRLAKPIHRLQVAANAVAVGNFEINQDLETKGIMELRQVGKSFNHMSQSLGNLIATQRKWMSSISHELRTPLTRLQLAAALIRRKSGDSSELQRIEWEIELLNKMVGDLLLLSRNQAQNVVCKQDINLPELWKTVLDNAMFEAEQTQIDMQVDIQIRQPQSYQVHANLEGLESAIENVIRNALKYTNSCIKVTLKIHHNAFLMQVDDDGDALDEKEYLRIFTPFYRIDEYRTQTSEGVGLGLSLAQSTIQAHQGEIWAEKSPLGGLRMNIKLPVLKLIH